MTRPAIPALLAVLLLAPACIPVEADSIVRCEGVPLGFQNLEKGNFNTSKVDWARLKAERGSSYCYQVRQHSWSGWSATTMVRLEGDTVVQRAYYEDSTGEGGSAWGDSWVEGSGEIGSHLQGAPADTLDALYDRCQLVVLPLNPATNTITFLVDSETGVLRNCSFFATGCVDDCREGVWIDALSLAR